MKIRLLLISLAGLGITGFLSAGERTKAKEGGIKSLNTYAAKMLKEKKYDDAINAYTFILEMEKSKSAIQNTLFASAKAKAANEDFGGAVNDLIKAGKTVSGNAKADAAFQLKALLFLTSIYAEKINDYPKAFSVVEEALNNGFFSGNPAHKKALLNRKNSLQRSEVNSLLKLKKYDEARRLASANYEKAKSLSTLTAFLDTETAFCKYLLGTKKFAEAEALARKLAAIKGAKKSFYWHNQALILQIKTRKKDFAGAEKELAVLKKTPGGIPFYLVMEEVRLLLAMQKSDAAISLLLKSAENPSFKAKERGNFYNSAALNVLIKNMNVKRAEEYYEKAKALSGAKFRNLQLEKLLKSYRNK
jgi:hypothetical protein